MTDLNKETQKIKEKNKRLTLLGAGPSPIRILARYLNNKDLAKKEKMEINKLIMQVDDLKGDDEKRRHDAKVKTIIDKINLEMEIKKAKKKPTILG